MTETRCISHRGRGFFSGLLILSILCACAALPANTEESLPVPVKDGYTIHYEEVVEVDDTLKQNDLFNRTKLWVAQNYKKTAFFNPIQLEERDNGLIIVNIFYKYSTRAFIHQYNYTVYSVGKIQVKDGKYKYTFSDFTYVCSGSNKHYEVKEPVSCANFIYQHNLRNPSSGVFTKALYGLDDGMKRVIALLHKSLTEPDDF